MSTNALLEAAQRYAHNGAMILPCHATDSAHGKAKAPHITNWKQRATSDSKCIYAWWHKWPDALIGLVIPRHLIVIDIDPRNGGSVTSLEDLIKEPLPPTLACISGRHDGGRHYYFQRPAESIRIGCNIAPGIDVLADRYVIVPPSPHPVTGKEYQWENCHVPAPPPQGLISLLRAPTSAPKSPLNGPVARAQTRGDHTPAQRLKMLSKARPGVRNNALFRTALTAFREQWDSAPERLEAAALAAGLERAEIRRTIQSAQRATMPTANDDAGAGA